MPTPTVAMALEALNWMSATQMADYFQQQCATLRAFIESSGADAADAGKWRAVKAGLNRDRDTAWVSWTDAPHEAYRLERRTFPAPGEVLPPQKKG